MVQRTGTRLANKMVARATKITAQGEREAKRAWTSTKSQFKSADNRVSTYIKQNPKKAALIAVGIGAAIAAALATAMRQPGLSSGRTGKTA